MANIIDLADLNEIQLKIDELEPSDINIEPTLKPIIEPTTSFKPTFKPTTMSIQTQTNSDKNGWNVQNQSYFQICLHRLKYYRVINNFYFFELKKREGRLSWAIIVLSSFSSVLSLITSDKELFPHSPKILKWLLVFFTLVTTLIGAFIKKQQFID